MLFITTPNNFPKMETMDPLVSGQNVGFNLGVGHYFAETKRPSPLPVLEKKRVSSASTHILLGGVCASREAQKVMQNAGPTQFKPLFGAEVY
jgi:hypothetical protein